MENEVFMRFFEGKEKALTFSYDDGVVFDKHLIELFDEHGVKATFNINSGVFPHTYHGRMSEQETFETFSFCNHEIALHGRRHLFLTKVSLPQVVDEIINDRVYLEEKYNRVVNGMAYAYGAFNDDIKNMLSCCGVRYSRTVNSTHNFAIPNDFLEWNPTCHHNDAQLGKLADKFLNTSPSDFIKEREPYLFYVWGHSYEFDDNNNWHVMENLLKKVGGRNDVWYATNGQIEEYVAAFKNLQFGVRSNIVKNVSAVDVWIEQRGKVYKIPSGKTVLTEL